jgi:formyltetrahydrofolate deformylase
MHKSLHRYTLQISCPDQKGLIAGITNLLHSAGANIIDLNQHTATDVDSFFLRAVYECENGEGAQVIPKTIAEFALDKSMQWDIFKSDLIPKIALFVSKTDHCLYELLLKQRDGEIKCNFCCIISNHPDHQKLASSFGIDFFYVPSTQNRQEQESAITTILQDKEAEAIVLARYMQILSDSFTRAWKNKIINIHHGFLPAFQGARPYHQAWEKGVKMIGATAHFATAELDQGPIIWQDVEQVPNTSAVSDLVKIGKDIERRVLVFGLTLFLEHRLFVFQNRTFIL